MWEIKFEPTFVREAREIMKRHPQLREELAIAVELLAETGTLPDGYSLHALDNPGGNYNGHMDFHLSDGLCDVVVLYAVNKGRLLIRFVRMGTHNDLFHGPVR